MLRLFHTAETDPIGYSVEAYTCAVPNVHDSYDKVNWPWETSEKSGEYIITMRVSISLPGFAFKTAQHL